MIILHIKIIIILLVSQEDKSGKVSNDKQNENIPFISITLLISHFEIFGK